MAVNVGNAAPDFTLKNYNLEDVTLSSFKGNKNVVLLFFPFVNTGVCEKELCQTRDGMGQYEELNAEVLAISVDSPFSHKLWVDKHKFNFQLLSDFNKEVSEKYGVLGVFVPGKFDYNGVSKRSVFVLDKDQNVTHVEILDSPGDEPDYNAIQDALKKLS
ncbi:MAG: peroxiredoxin [Melioribacteraceae bacterium]|nr:peroxiredoxin [Melioribacteraceae bacterium]MCF8265027.1 peroxiredoxin [Melioribacteraceae bacterium]MCF8413810.1 peroxiredoxin [Melioribacteraceae bacterium]